MVNDEAESVLARDPAERQTQLETLRAAFIPWLATINPQNDEPMRRTARLSDLPPESHKLIDALADKRLLLTDQREGEKIVEVAHEALLRRWDVLANWLHAEREDLKVADAVEQAAQDWEKNGRKDPWLMVGERLAIAEALAARPAYRRRLEPVSEFMLASRQRETQKQVEEERRRQAELDAAREKQAAAEALTAEQKRATEQAQADAARLKKSRKLLRYLLFAAIAVAFLAVWLAWKADQESKQATALQLNAEAQAMLSGARPGGTVLGLLKLLAAHRIAPHSEIENTIGVSLFGHSHLLKVIDADSRVLAVAVSPDGPLCQASCRL
ncbi:MAG: hypothetical protein M3A44_10590 [Gammaproteobacteria bacterium]